MAVQLFEKLMFKLWKFRQNTYKNSRIWCLRILKHRSIDFIVRFVGEIKEAIFCLPLFIFIPYCKALRFLAILSIVWEKFLKSRNAVVIWQSADEAYRVNHSTVVACIETQVLGFLNILNSFCRILNLSRKKWNKPRPFFKNWRPCVTGI